MLLWQTVWIGVATFMYQTRHVTSHGSLIQPAQRSGAWRFGFDNPVNYNDNQLYCGGKGVQWNAENNGRCGVCGDPYNVAEKPNEDVNGTFVQNGVITGSYVRGSVMTTKVNLTAYHKGWFEFRLCPLKTFTTKVTQACLNRTVLLVVGSNSARINLEGIKKGSGAAIYEIDLQLPSNISCERCVLQWRYNTGNSWGCEPGKCCIGCGKQENFVNCADIKISEGDTTGPTFTTKRSSSASQSVTMSALTSSTTSKTSTQSDTSSTSTSTPTKISSTSPAVTTTKTATTTQPTATTRGSSTSSVNTSLSTDALSSSTSGKQSTATTTSGNGGVLCSQMLTCSAAGLFVNIPGLGQWCCDNCLRNYCPPSHCLCTSNTSN